MRSPQFRRKALVHGVLCALAAASFFAVTDADARVTRLVPDGPPTPAFGGASIGAVGPYERITGWAYGELDPKDPLNAVIVDIENAPRNKKGNVEYSFNFYILKPVDLSKGAHKMFYEPPNRGGKLSGGFLKLISGNDPAATPAAQAQAAFLTQQGYTMAWNGWDFAAGAITSDPYKGVINLPVAHNKNGSSITGPSFEYFTGNGGTSLPINYVPANAADKATAVLTHRVHLDDAPQPMDPSTWNYDAAGKNVVLTSGTYVTNDIYEFSYTAKDPAVNGIGFAAVRDFNSFLRYGKKDDDGNANPLAGDVKHIYTYTISQPGRLLNDFRHLGFNEDEKGRKVFDGMVNWIAAGDGINMNLRFSQPGRTERNRQDHLFAEGIFPFSNFITFDPITHRIDSRYVRCTLSGTCPLGMEIYSANEYWVKAASLLHTTPDGKFDLPDWPLARNYFMSSHQHGSGNGTKGSCQQKTNPIDSTPVHRALWMDMDQWVTAGVAPPPSSVPHLHDGTMVNPDQASVGFPHIPGVTYTGLKTTRYRFNYGPRFDDGIMDIDPPVHGQQYEDNPGNGPIYPSFVPKTDGDGNDIAGVRMPEVAVPTATYTGWGLRSGAQANDGCESNGQWIDFPATQADRLASGDPRLSVKERYPTHADYVAKVTGYVNTLVARRLMLPEDAQAAIAKAQASSFGN